MGLRIEISFFSFFLISIVLVLFSCETKSSSDEVVSQEIIPCLEKDYISDEQLNLNQAEGLVYYGEKLFTGCSKSIYENGNMAASIQFEKGIKNGVYQKWFEDGTLSFESFYLDGKQHGSTKTWWKNKHLRSESNYVNGIGNGIQKQYYETGEKFKAINLVNGKEEGLQKAWRKNGKLYNNYEAKNGRVFGMKRAGLCFELKNESVQVKD